ncbi:SDR family NAD(P)-dependent oxidoreductase [Halobacteriovorax sp. HLS]|uniref:SDR family NAD(P)-dependent oxidoreductase n=1 Tax=Halobacteriovorax sp. HLS TaxID=2234000 RepID=UPI000FD728DA|nr:3-oxoacyl-ACP reductase family protein [Halobacteriovorax sp. HLS]
MSKLDHWALVTGATGGIGQAIAKTLANSGYSILLHYGSNINKANSLKNTIVELGVSCELIQCDLSDLSSLEACLNDLSIKPKIIVNNAGITVDSLFSMIELDTFDKIMKVNAYAPFLIMKWAAKYMSRAKEGSIINISSVSGQIGNPGQASYSASKAALMTMSKTLGKELARKKVRVNSIAAGIIDTEMSEKIPKLDEIIEHIPARRLGNAQEIADVVEFLASSKSTYITGQILSVNGGLYTP